MFVSDLTPVWPKLQFPQCLKLHISTPDLLPCEIHAVCVHVHTHCVYNQAAISFYLKPSGNTVDTSSHNTHSACNRVKKRCVPGGRRSASVSRDKTTPRRDLTEQHDNAEAGNACIGIKKAFQRDRINHSGRSDMRLYNHETS